MRGQDRERELGAILLESQMRHASEDEAIIVCK
jgi:hypothetical protein